MDGRFFRDVNAGSNPITDVNSLVNNINNTVNSNVPNDCNTALSPAIGYARVKFMQRNAMTKTLIDSGNFFADLISENLACKLKAKIDRRFQKKVGTAQAHAKCEVLGKAGPLKINIENLPGSFVINPFVVRDLSHEMNLGQSFL